MAVPKKKTCSASTKRQRHSYKIKQQAKLRGAIDKEIRNEKGRAIFDAAKAEKVVANQNITVIQA